MEKPVPSAKELARMVVAFRLELLKQKKVDDETREALLVPLAELFKMIIPHVHKLDEFVYASKNGMKVEAALHGADMRDANGGFWELKVSIMNPKTGHYNFNWTVPRADTPEQRRAKLLANVRAKTAGGGAILRITDELGVLLKEFKFTHAFLMAYFQHVPFGVAATHNMGGYRCKVHNDFHRMEAINSAQFDFESCPETVDWKALFDKKTKKGKCHLAD